MIVRLHSLLQRSGLGGRACRHCRSVLRFSSQPVPSRTNSEEYRPLLETVQARQGQARQSILVQVRSAQLYTADMMFCLQVAGPSSAVDLASYCQQQFGPVNSLHYYNNTAASNNNFTDFLIVEFASPESVIAVLERSQHGAAQAPVPVRSPFLWLQGGVKASPDPTSVPLELADRPDLQQAEVEARALQDPSDQVSSTMFCTVLCCTVYCTDDAVVVRTEDD